MIDKKILNEDLTGLKMKIDVVTDLFYQQKDSHAFEAMDMVLNALSDIIERLFMYSSMNTGFTLDQDKLMGILKSTVSAMEERDNVLLADILSFDMKEMIDEIIEKLM